MSGHGSSPLLSVAQGPEGVAGESSTSISRTRSVVGLPRPFPFHVFIEPVFHGFHPCIGARRSFGAPVIVLVEEHVRKTVARLSVSSQYVEVPLQGDDPFARPEELFRSYGPSRERGGQMCLGLQVECPYEAHAGDLAYADTIECVGDDHGPPEQLSLSLRGRRAHGLGGPECRACIVHGTMYIRGTSRNR